jgi:RNA polymerase sigma-70 factor (ECF subfamily)
MELLAASAVLPDEEIVARVQKGEHALFEILMRRHNQRLYRAARAILRDENEVEDVLQQTYMNAFSHLQQFESRSLFSTWLTRILINEASRRRRKLERSPSGGPAVDAIDEHDGPTRPTEPNPEHRAYASELRRVLEDAVDSLPDSYRIVFMLRDVEGMSTSETALALGLADEAVKTRLHRGRAMIRRAVRERLGSVAADAFPFHAPRCDRVVYAVLTWIANPER